MDSDQISEEDRQLFKLLQAQGLSIETAMFIGKMIGHLQILAMNAKLPSVAKHLDAAISACATTRLN